MGLPQRILPQGGSPVTFTDSNGQLTRWLMSATNPVITRPSLIEVQKVNGKFTVLEEPDGNDTSTLVLYRPLQLREKCLKCYSLNYQFERTTTN